ncbi:MAG: cysteine desulfurase-like protein [Verrucomicrobiota bacterium]
MKNIAPPVLAVESIRDRFPALQRKQNGRAVAYFDGPGGTQVPREVIAAIVDYLSSHNANTHWAYPSSIETDEIIAQARGALAEFISAQPSEIVFGANMTTLTFHLARALGRDWGPGDEIVITELDHHANVAPWRALEKERGITIRIARILPEKGQLDWEDFERQLNPRTRIVAVGAASNALGTITDVRRAAAAAHAVGALVFVDAVHYAPHRLVDVREIDCDFLSCSSYKFYGPHLGVLYGREHLLAQVDFPKLLPAPDGPPERAETGTQNHEGIAGAAAAIEFLASLAEGDTRRQRLASAYAELHTRGAALLKQLWEGLAAIDHVRLFGPPPEALRTPTVAFTIAGISPAEAATRLAERGLYLSHGDFYAATVIDRLGLAPEGLIRAGCSCYTTSNEIERLLSAVQDVSHGPTGQPTPVLANETQPN